MSKDKIVANIYETYDYDKFTIIPENRGHVETKGLKARKLLQLQELVNNGKYCEEYGLVKVNKELVIFDGRHTFELRKLNGMPIRYLIIEDEKYNDVTKKDLLNNVYNVNKINTAWSGNDLFKAAFQTKRPLAIQIQNLMDAANNRFVWTDIIALLTKNDDYFVGRLHDLDLTSFSDKTLLEEINSKAFKLEYKYFLSLNDKARVALRKGMIIKTVYSVLWKAREIVDPLKLRTTALNIPDEVLDSKKTVEIKKFIPILIKHYNKQHGQSVKAEAVVFQCCKIHINSNGKHETAEVVL